MSGKYKEKKSKSYVGIIIVLIVIAVIAGVIVLFFISKNSEQNNAAAASSVSLQTENTTVSPTASSKTESTSPNALQASSKATQQSSQSVAESKQPAQSAPEKVVVPDSEEADESSYFEAVYTPYKAVDTDTGNTVSMREVFGTSYSGGTFVFNSDGTFTDNLSISSVNSGAYSVSGNTIRATYTNDKNLSISVIASEGNIPSEIVINYGGYDVYFN